MSLASSSSWMIVDTWLFEKLPDSIESSNMRTCEKSETEETM